MDLGLTGANVLITGGTKGIGAAAARLFAQEGANVALCARDAALVAETVTSLAAAGAGRAIGGALDVGDPKALKAWVEASATELGGVDALVCNVSALALGDTAESWQKSFQVDMMHTVHAVAAALPYLEKSPIASVAVVSSVSGFEVDAAAGSYGATKAALIHYAKGLARQLAGKGIRVNTISPGNTYFEGGFWQGAEQNMPDLFNLAMASNPTGRMGTAEEVAFGIVMLASPLASRITGTNLVIDGALSRSP
ncbi:MAG: SDR family oxidoreductase [Nevskia sp.]|nr:SDR family oxidoreductase [Nevskia sp.]